LVRERDGLALDNLARLELTRPGNFRNGETRTRTGDTTIFSRVLYQLSYLAGPPDATGLLLLGLATPDAQPAVPA
jgi:hypothetical protein